MHALVSWNIKAESPQWEELNEELKSCLEDYSWVKPLSTLYIVQIEDAYDHLSLKESLAEVCRDHPNMIHFVMGPPIQGGNYDGWLPKSLWPAIRKRVSGVA